MKLYEELQVLFRSTRTGDVAAPSAFQTYTDTLKWAEAQGFDPRTPAPPYTGEHDARDAVADTIIERIEAGRATAFDHFRLDALYGQLQAPAQSLRDAVTLYLEERNRPEARSDVKRKQFEQRIRRAERYLLASLGRDKPLADISRADARAFRDFMARKRDGRDATSALEPGTVNRILNDVRAIFSHASDEFGLEKDNPFKGLRIEDQVSSKEKRRSFQPDELRRYLDAFEGRNPDARHCTILMAFTGARTSEITGLEAGDIQLSGDVPHIIIRPNATRQRLKTSGSQRRIPLIGPALCAAEEAVIAMKGNPGPLFPRYAEGRGTDNLSALQNKVIRQGLKIADPKLNPYSTRHMMKDNLRNALISPDLQDAIMGHSRGQIADGYGDGFWLPRLKEAMEKALEGSH